VCNLLHKVICAVFITHMTVQWNKDCSVGIMNGLWTGQLRNCGLVPGRDRSFSKVSSRAALEVSQPAVKWILGTDHLSHSDEVKNVLHLCPEYSFVVLSLIKYRQNFILTVMEYHGSTYSKRCDILSFVGVKVS